MVFLFLLAAASPPPQTPASVGTRSSAWFYSCATNTQFQARHALSDKGLVTFEDFRRANESQAPHARRTAADTPRSDAPLPPPSPSPRVATGAAHTHKGSGGIGRYRLNSAAAGAPAHVGPRLHRSATPGSAASAAAQRQHSVDSAGGAAALATGSQTQAMQQRSRSQSHSSPGMRAQLRSDPPRRAATVQSGATAGDSLSGARSDTDSTALPQSDAAVPAHGLEQLQPLHSARLPARQLLADAQLAQPQLTLASPRQSIGDLPAHEAHGASPLSGVHLPDQERAWHNGHAAPAAAPHMTPVAAPHMQQEAHSSGAHSPADAQVRLSVAATPAGSAHSTRTSSPAPAHSQIPRPRSIAGRHVPRPSQTPPLQSASPVCVHCGGHSRGKPYKAARGPASNGSSSDEVITATEDPELEVRSDQDGQNASEREAAVLSTSATPAQQPSSANTAPSSESPEGCAADAHTETHTGAQARAHAPDHSGDAAVADFGESEAAPAPTAHEPAPAQVQTPVAPSPQDTDGGATDADADAEAARGANEMEDMLLQQIASLTSVRPCTCR